MWTVESGCFNELKAPGSAIHTPLPLWLITLSVVTGARPHENGQQSLHKKCWDLTMLSGRVGPHTVRASSKDVPREVGGTTTWFSPNREASPPLPAFPLTECYCWPYTAVKRAEEKEVLCRSASCCCSSGPTELPMKTDTNPWQPRLKLSCNSNLLKFIKAVAPRATTKRQHKRDM